MSDQQALAVAHTPMREAPSELTKKTAVTPKPTTHKSLIPNDLPGFRNAWIHKQDPNHFTLQLVAGNNVKTLRDFFRQHPLDEPLAIYQGIRKGKPWFGVIQRNYPSKQAAITARSQLSASLRKEGPWVRRFAALQKDLHRTP